MSGRDLLVLVCCLGMMWGCTSSSSSTDSSTNAGNDASVDVSSGTPDTSTISTDTKFSGSEPTYPQGSISNGETLNTPIAINGTTTTLSLTKCPAGKFNGTNSKFQGNWRVYAGGVDGSIIAGKVTNPDENNCTTDAKDPNRDNVLCRLSYHFDREYFEERYAYYQKSQATYRTSIIKGYFACTDKSTDDFGPRVLFVITEVNADAQILGNDTGDNSQFNIELLEKSETDPLFGKDMFWYLYFAWDKMGGYSDYTLRKCTDWTCDTVVQ